MATVKEIIQSFCSLYNVPVPTAIVSVLSPNERQLLACFKKIGDNLRNRPYQWPQLKREYVFTVTSGSRTVELPGDFYRLRRDTQFDVTNNWPLNGPLSDGGMASRKYAVATSLQTRKAYKIIGPSSYLLGTAPYVQRSAGSIELDPIPDNSSDQLVLGYISCSWVWPVDWATGASYSAGALVTGVKNIYHTAAGGTSGATRPSGSSGTISDGTVNWTVYREPYLVTETNTKLNDNDLCLFDDDLMIQGMNWAWLEAKKMDYQQARLDWEDSVKSATARHEGILKLNMADGPEYDDGEWPLSPSGSWSV